MDLNELADGVAVITGGGSGLGMALGMKAASLNMHVVISDIRADVGKAAVKEICQNYSNIQCRSFRCDVTKLSEVEALLDYTRKEFPTKSIKFVGANAGILLPETTILTGSYEEWLNTYNVNVLGVFNTLRTFTPFLLSQSVSSAVEITCSIAGVMAGGFGPYGTSKLASLGIAEALVNEIRLFKKYNDTEGNVSVVALCPGVVQTNLLQTSEHMHSDSRASTKVKNSGRNDPSSTMAKEYFNQSIRNGMSSEYCAEKTFEYLEKGNLYCILLDGSNEHEMIEKILRLRHTALVSRKSISRL